MRGGVNVSRRNKTPPKNWQSDTRRNKRQTFARIYSNQLICPAWLDLTNAQRVLYIACRDREFFKHPAETGTAADDNLFFMNRDLYVNYYGLYKANNKRGFIRDRNALISHGFISIYRSGKNTRTKSVYTYSDKWKEWQPGDDYT